MDEESVTAFSPSVLNTLENMLAPGQRARLSPYVESAQLYGLFSKLSDLHHHKASIHHIVKDHSDHIQSLAKTWVDFVKCGKSFSDDCYTSERFLEAYLAYYFSVNVSKIQLSLLNMARSSVLPSEWNVLDIGVGSGTTAIAFLDFLLTWKTVCDLYDTEFPVKSLRFQGVDRVRETLAIAHKVIEGYAQSLENRNKTRRDDFYDWLIENARGAIWSRYEIGVDSDVFANVNFVVISNVLNELDCQDRNKLTAELKKLPEDALILACEPGDEKHSKDLMGFKHALVTSGKFSKQGPCGNEFGNNLPAACYQCWNAQRYGYLDGKLYEVFRKEADRLFEDKRGFDPYHNKHLSWSYIWLKRGTSVVPTNSLIFSEGDKWPKKVLLRYIGKYRKKTGNDEKGPVGYRPDTVPINSNSWEEYIKFCPGYTSV